MNKLTDNEIIKALEYCCGSIQNDCRDCPFGERCENDESLLKYSLDLINRKDAEIERLKANNEDKEETIQYADKEIKRLNAEVERLNNELVSADEVIGFREAEIERLKETFKRRVGKEIEETYSCLLEEIKSEAYKEFAERLCKDRVSNAPVVIAVKVELEELTEGGNEPPKNDSKE